MNSVFEHSVFTCVADAIGLGYLGDDDFGISPEYLRQLYAYARGEGAEREFFERDRTFARGWLNAGAEAAYKLMNAFVPLDNDRNFHDARKIAKQNLEAVAWNDALGIEAPPIQCEVRLHGKKWGFRFRDATPTMKGSELINEQLPPADGGHIVAGKEKTQAPAQAVADVVDDAVAEVLRKGGLPV